MSTRLVIEASLTFQQTRKQTTFVAFGALRVNTAAMRLILLTSSQY